MQRVFSGIQPTGNIHIGNYLGAIRNWVELQHKYESLFCVVDYHAITVEYQPEQLHKRVLELAATLIAAGIDPDKTTLFVQSSVPEHAELTWLLTCITSIGALERMTQFKEKAERQKSGVFAGLMNYPILMASDILIYKAEFVPVGDDQIQHLELTREIARRFNTMFKETFPEPQPILTKAARIMALNDPTSKMSKSIEGSYIAMDDDDDTIRKKIRRAVTDPGPQGGEMGPGVKNLFTLLEAFAEPDLVEKFRAEYANQSLRYADLKQELGEAIVTALAPIRERTFELLAKPDQLIEILDGGAKHARRLAQETVAEVREAMGFKMPVA
ncbi:MAG TPA: tryptophan--tRNA ligase [Firmicutes bacterium]|nr:tryptophan--tRNA ligase [Bacillota bacterium]